MSPLKRLPILLSTLIERLIISSLLLARSADPFTIDSENDSRLEVPVAGRFYKPLTRYQASFDLFSSFLVLGGLAATLSAIEMVTMIITGYLDKTPLATANKTLIALNTSVELSVAASMAILCWIIPLAAGLWVLGIHDVISRIIFDCFG